jgi:hypothetical protein
MLYPAIGMHWLCTSAFITGEWYDGRVDSLHYAMQRLCIFLHCRLEASSKPALGRKALTYIRELVTGPSSCLRHPRNVLWLCTLMLGGACAILSAPNAAVGQQVSSASWFGPAGIVTPHRARHFQLVRQALQEYWRQAPGASVRAGQDDSFEMTGAEQSRAQVDGCGALVWWERKSRISKPKSV